MATGGALIGALRVTLGLDSSQFEAGTKRARQVANRDAMAIQRQLEGINKSFNNLKNAAITTALVAAGKRALEYASSLGEVAQQAGVTAKELQEYRYAASQVGISNEEMDKSLTKLTRTIGEAKAGSKEQATVFRDLGVAIQDANGRVYTAGQVIPKLADALSKIKDPATRARYEVDLFGKTGQKLDTLLAGGSSAVNELRDAAQKLGIVLSDRQIQNADDTADKLAAIKQVLEARIAGVVADNADAIVSLANAFAQLADMAARANKVVPGLIATLAGATIGGALGGAPGAGAGAILGGAAGLLQYAYDDPLQLRKETPKGLVERQRKLTQQLKTSSRAGHADTAEFKELAGMSDMIDAEINRRLAALRAGQPVKPVPVVGDGALPAVSGGRSRSRKGPKDKSQQYLEQYNRQIMGLMEDELQLTGELTTDLQTRADLEHRRVAASTTAAMFEIDGKEAAGEYTKGQADRVRLLTMSNGRLEQQVIDEKLADDLSAEVLQLSVARQQAQIEILEGERASARTTAERRRIELSILDHQKAIEAAQIAKVLADNQSTLAAKEEAQMRQDSLAQRYGMAAENVRRDTMGPMESWMDSLPRSAGELKERFESIRVDALNNGLDLAASKVVKLKGFAGDLFNQLIHDVIRLQLQAAIAGGQGGGLLGSLGKLLGLASAAAGGSPDVSGMTHEASGHVPGMAGGGSFLAGGNPGIDRNVLSINGIPRARVSANENIKVGHGGAGGQPIVIAVEEGALFRPVVRGEAADVSFRALSASNRAIGRRQTRRLA